MTDDPSLKIIDQMIRDLGKRVVALILNRREIVGRETPMPDVTHYSYDLNRLVAQSLHPQNLSNGIFSPKGVVRHVFVDHHNLRATESIVVIEETATK